MFVGQEDWLMGRSPPALPRGPLRKSAASGYGASRKLLCRLFTPAVGILYGISFLRRPLEVVDRSPFEKCFSNEDIKY